VIISQETFYNPAKQTFDVYINTYFSNKVVSCMTPYAKWISSKQVLKALTGANSDSKATKTKQSKARFQPNFFHFI